MTKTVAVLLVSLLTLVVSRAHPQEQTARLTPASYLDWEEVINPQISPDGQRIVYVRRSVDKVNDVWRSSLWLVNADGTRHRFFVDGGGAAWSQGGARIAYVARGEPSGAQIFVRWMDAAGAGAGATTQITHVENSPGGLSWSPDGKSLAFVMTVPTHDVWNIDMPPRPKGARWTRAPKVITRLQYRVNGAGYTDGGYRHIFVVSATGGTPRQLTDGDWNHSRPEWTPDGSEILFSSNRVPDADWALYESEIYSVQVRSGEIRQLTRRNGPDESPKVSPDGRFVAYTGFDSTDATYLPARVYVMNRDGSNPRDIMGDLDRYVRSLMWSGDSRGVYFNIAENGRVHLYFAPVDGSGPRKITDGDHLLQSTSLSSGGLITGVWTDAYEPGDVFVLDVERPGDIRKVTDVNGDVLAGRQLGQVEEIWYPSFDNLPIQGWIVKPPDFDPSRKYPLILVIHGGPHAMYGFGGAPLEAGIVYYWYDFQDFAADDYVVLYTNPRGSLGYGSAFGNAIMNAYPGDDYHDLMIGVDSILNRGYIDERNMFVTGCSGGGILTAWIVGHTDRFAAASSNCPVTNFLSFVGTADFALYWYQNFASLPWDDPSEHLRRSPLMYAGNVTTPTLILVGDEDLRAPPAQGVEFYQALKLLKVPTALIRFHDEPHGFHVKPSNFLRSQAYMRSWFDRYKTKDEPGTDGG